MQITWSEIEAECGNYKQGFVATFKKYEGLETDSRSAQNKAIYVTVSSFAGRMGIPESTFRRWVEQEEGTRRESSSRNSNIKDKMEAEVAKAKAEAEAIAAERLAEALAIQQEQAMAEKRAAEAAAADRHRQQAIKHEAEIKAVQERMKQEKLEALARQEKQLKDEAKNHGFDLTQLTDADKAKVMSLIGNDPAQAKEWFRAYDAERARKKDEATRKAQEDSERKRSQMAEREAREAARKASLAYEESALHFYLTKVYPQLLKFEEMMQDKPITFDTIMYSRMAPSQIVPKFDRGEDIVCAGREAIFLAKAEAELADIQVED